MSNKISSGQRLKEVRERLGLKQGEFARPFGLQNKGLSAIENGRSKLGEEHLRVLMEKFQVNPVWILSGEGTMLLSEDSKTAESESDTPVVVARTEFIPVTVDSSGDENITVVGTKVAAGYAHRYLEPEFLRELPAFSLPGTRYKNGTFRAFEVAGDSMEPTCYPGDLVIAQKLYGWPTEIKEGYVHIVVTHESVLIKRVMNRLMESGRLMLKSDNPAFSTQFVEGEEVQEVWVAKAKLSSQFINTRYDAAREVASTQADLAELAAEVDIIKKALADKLGVPVRALGTKKKTPKS